MLELLVVVGDEEGVPGVGPGGSVKQLRPVSVNSIHVGWIDVRSYREGVYVDCYAKDGKVMLFREQQESVGALNLSLRHFRNERRPAQV